MKNLNHDEAVLVLLSNSNRSLAAVDLGAQLSLSTKRVQSILRQLLIADQIVCAGASRNGVLVYQLTDELREKIRTAKEAAFQGYRDVAKAGDGAVVAALDGGVA